MKKIYYDSSLLPQLNNYIFLDTNFLIGAIKFPELFGNFIDRVKGKGGILITIPSVSFEFLRGTETKDAYDKRSDFISSICSIYPIQVHLNDIKIFLHILGKEGKNMSYSDFLLCVCLYKFGQKAKLISADLKDIPLKYFDRINLITVDTDLNTMVYGVYSQSTRLLDAKKKNEDNSKKDAH